MAALCPGTLALLLTWALPQSVINSKQPGWFISHTGGVRACTLCADQQRRAGHSLAWDLDRSDIQLLGDRGELGYGLSYPDVARDKYIEHDDSPPG